MPDQWGRPTFNDWAGLASGFMGLGAQIQNDKDRELDRQRAAQNFEMREKEFGMREKQFDLQQQVSQNQLAEQEQQRRIAEESAAVANVLGQEKNLFKADLSKDPRFKGFLPQSLQRGKYTAMGHKAQEYQMETADMELQQVKDQQLAQKALQRIGAARTAGEAADAINALPLIADAIPTDDGTGVALTNPFTGEMDVYTYEEVKALAQQHPEFFDSKFMLDAYKANRQKMTELNMAAAFEGKRMYDGDKNYLGTRTTQIKATGDGRFKTYYVWSDQPLDENGRVVAVTDAKGAMDYETLNETLKLQKLALEVQNLGYKNKPDIEAIKKLGNPYYGRETLTGGWELEDSLKSGNMLFVEYAGKLIDNGVWLDEGTLTGLAHHTERMADQKARKELAKYQKDKLAQQKFEKMEVSSADEFIEKRKREIMFDEELPKAVAGLAPKKDSNEAPAPAPADDGRRVDGTKKGPGFLGSIKMPDGSVATEISVGVNLGGKETEIPALVPTLTKEEVQYLQKNYGKPGLFDTHTGKAIVKKAVDHALQRINEGKSPFATMADVVSFEGEGKLGSPENVSERVKVTRPEKGAVVPPPKPSGISDYYSTQEPGVEQVPRVAKAGYGAISDLSSYLQAQQYPHEKRPKKNQIAVVSP